MTTQPTVTTPTLFDYQEEAVSDFIEWVRAGERMIGLVSPTGSGKTVMLVEFLRRSGVLGLLSSAVIAVPMESIERAFEQQGGPLVYCPRDDKNGLSRYRAHLRADRASPLAFLTTRQQVTRWGLDEFPNDLAGRVLVLDEAHHAATGKDSKKLDTEIGKLRDEWHARGGTVLLMTATPFRSDGQDVLPAGTRTHVRTLAMHAASGHAPNHFQVQTAMLSKVEAHTVAELQGESLSASENAHGESFRDLVDLWERDGRPKAVFIVPANGSRRWADRLIAALSKSTPRERILDAVGMGKDVANTLATALDGERNVTTFTDSKYDVIVSCKRFDEGTDWPLCSHVYNYGIPSSLGLILQRFGRATRDKSRISGHTHPDTASITFLVPKVADDLLDAMETKHHRLALTLAILQEDWRLARSMGADLSTRLHDSWTAGQRRAQGREDQPAKPSARPERVRDDLRLDAKATLIAWQAKQEQATGRPATLAERHAYVEGLGMEGDKRRAMVAAALDLDVADQPEVMDFVQTEAPGLGYDFEAILRAVGAAFPGSVSDETGNVLKIMSAFTGQDVAQVVERIGAAGPPWSEPIVLSALMRRLERTGKSPNAESGDATLDFGFATTWERADDALREGRGSLPGGDSLARFMVRHGFKRSSNPGKRHEWLNTPSIVEAVRKRIARTGDCPNSNSGDASEDFGRPYTWALVAEAVKRGLPDSTVENDTFPRFLVRHGFRGEVLQRKPASRFTDEYTLSGIERFKTVNGRYPEGRDGNAGAYFDDDNITWNSISATRVRLGMSTVHDLIWNHPLDRAKVRAAVVKFIELNGRHPHLDDGDATEYFGRPEWWNSVHTAFKNSSRGLTGSPSLFAFIRDEGLVQEVSRSRDVLAANANPSSSKVRCSEPDLTATEKTTGRKTRVKTTKSKNGEK